ncbi:hypothetical protein [Pradoshia sp.]|uniref:hypothetical protein n=1 Tax=Pradoshia sp. TaxID=2651281 RepID=UPI003F0D67F2
MLKKKGWLLAGASALVITLGGISHRKKGLVYRHPSFFKIKPIKQFSDILYLLF